VHRVVALLDRKRPAVAPEDVGGRGLGVAAVVAVAVEAVVVVHAAGDVAGAGLRVDRQVREGVVRVDVVDVVVEDAREGRGLLGDEVARRDDADDFAGGVVDAEVA
jgi:hypothetical protein